MTGIQSLSIRHEAIMEFIMANPTVKMGDVAAFFCVTPAWLSQIIHSDVFQAELRNKTDIAFHHTVLPIREKMLAVANQALDELIDKIPMETQPANLSKIAGDVLDRLGYTPKKGPSVQVNNYTQINALREEVDAARQLLVNRAPARLEVEIDGERTPIALPGNGAAKLGPAFQETALQLISRENGSEEVRGAVREEGPCEA